MLGGGGGGGSCGGPVSWWCSEVFRCSPKVAPHSSTSASQMADCEQCNAKFTLFRRRRACGTCGLVFCSSCVKRGASGSRRCNKCIILTQWPLDVSEVNALRVKDLRQYLHAQCIDTTTCTEKRDLIDLVTRHISSQHRGTGYTTSQRTSNGGNNTHNASVHRNYKPPPYSSTTDDGIRVRPSSINGDSNNTGSIRVRAVDSIRVRPTPSQSTSPDSNDYDPETDMGIRVFASVSEANQHRPTSASPVSAEGHSECAEEDCSQCQSEESCCSLESCGVGASSQSAAYPMNDETSSSQNSAEEVSPSTEGHVPDTDVARRSDEWILIGDDVEPVQLEVGVSLMDASEGSPVVANTDSESTSPPNTSAAHEEEQIFANAGEQIFANATPSSSPSSSASASTASSPEPKKFSGPGIVPLRDIKAEEDIRCLSVRQCKEILTLHRVNYAGVREKSELVKKIELLWRDYQNSRQDVDTLPDDLVCKICMDSMIDCVLLECGHMVACTMCGKQMSECPVCRQYVVRVVRTFRA